MQTKSRKAVTTIAKCKAQNGFYASADRYRYEYWTRDLYYSFDTLKDLGLLNCVKIHLMNLWKRQKLTGELPRLMIDFRFKWISSKAILKIETHKVLSTIKALTTIETRFRRWTVDSTILGILATYEYAVNTKEKQFLEVLKPKIEKGLKYLEKHIKDYLIRGVDWRDSMPELKEKFLLSNNVMLYKLYKTLGMSEKAIIIKNRINAEFWNGEYYVDDLGGQNFDSLGTSLAVLNDLVPKTRYKLITKKLLSASSKYGIKNVIEIEPISEIEKILIQSCNQRYAIWPFVSAYAIMALLKMGQSGAAKNELKKLTNLPGFYEWYDPDNGKHHGSRDQLWSAATYYLIAKNIRPK